jgi:hypothetical protein
VSGSFTLSTWPRASMKGCAVSTLCAITGGQVHRLLVELDLALADARDVEQLLDQPRQVAAPGGPSRRRPS